MVSFQLDFYVDETARLTVKLRCHGLHDQYREFVGAVGETSDFFHRRMHLVVERAPTTYTVVPLLPLRE